MYNCYQSSLHIQELFSGFWQGIIIMKLFTPALTDNFYKSLNNSDSSCLQDFTKYSDGFQLCNVLEVFEFSSLQLIEFLFQDLGVCSKCPEYYW